MADGRVALRQIVLSTNKNIRFTTSQLPRHNFGNGVVNAGRWRLEGSAGAKAQRLGVQRCERLTGEDAGDGAASAFAASHELGMATGWLQRRNSNEHADAQGGLSQWPIFAHLFVTMIPAAGNAAGKSEP